MKMENKKELSPEQREELIRTLKARFEKNMNRHIGLEWAKVQSRLEANTEKLWSDQKVQKSFSISVAAFIPTIKTSQSIGFPSHTKGRGWS